MTAAADDIARMILTGDAWAFVDKLYPRFETITCPTCHGTGKHSWTYHGAEMQERCRTCEGKGLRVVERFT